jgi:hypothetical protein
VTRGGHAPAHGGHPIGRPAPQCHDPLFLVRRVPRPLLPVSLTPDIPSLDRLYHLTQTYLQITASHPSTSYNSILSFLEYHRVSQYYTKLPSYPMMSGSLRRVV